MKQVAVIGAGIGGIALAIRMAVKGWKVEVFEANDYPGGKLSEFNTSGYRFDAGPSLFTLPTLVDELFLLAGKNPEDYFQYKKLDEVCKYFWNDGMSFSVSSNRNEFDALVSKKLGEQPGKVLEYLKDSEFKYHTLNDLFLQKSLHKVSTWVSKDAFKGYINLAKMGIFGNLNSHNSNFFKNPKTIQLFNRYATYNGSDPYQTPATMSIIPHLEYNVGAFFPKFGMNQITNSLYTLGQDLGVKFNFGNKVEEIIVKNSKANGLKINGKLTAEFDAIVSNMDVTPTYRKLMPTQEAPNKTLNQEKSGSGLIFYWGVKKQFKELGLHNIFFSDNYAEEFNQQFKHKNIYNDPTLYLNITAKHKQNDAPAGCENWFLLINAPTNTGQDWVEIIKRTRKNAIDKLNNILKIDLNELIECEQILDPQKIEFRTSSSQGSLYGNSSNNRFAAFLRHPNFSSKIKNLFFVGGSVHPGGGIPLALSSAKITSEFLA
jgi:phytoene desaturase